jgi:putrescine aminotransferase
MTTNAKKKFGFIVHCRSTKELRQALIRYHMSPLSLLPETKLKSYCLQKGYIEDTFTFQEVISDKDAVCQGKTFCILLTPEQLIENQVLATELVKRACAMAEEWGAEMIGLGAITAVVGSRGLEAAKSSSVAVTTGNSLTAYASIVAFEKILQRLNIDVSQQKVVIIGFPGSIALSLTKLLSKKQLDLVLVSRRKTAFLNRFLNDFEGNGTIETTQDISSALEKGKIIFTATSTGNIIDPNLLPAGSIVFDIAQPRDVIYKKNARKDALIIDAGIVSLPRSTEARYHYCGWEENDIPSCLAETITLTFEKRWERFSLGRELDVEKIQEIGRLSEQHGFIFDEFRSFNKPIQLKNFEATKNALLGS